MIKVEGDKMELLIRGDRMKVTEAMNDYVKDKLKKLEKYLEESEQVRANILVKVKGYTQKVEVTIPLKSFLLRAEEEAEDFYVAIDKVIDKLERQIKKNKTKLASKMEKTTKDFILDYMDEENDEQDSIVKRKKVEVKPMDEEEAILQMELIGHQFYLFKDIDTGKPVVVYKRKDSGYGIIEAE